MAPAPGTFERLAASVTAHGEPFELAVTAPDIRSAVTEELGLPSAFVARYEKGPEVGTAIPWITEDLLLFSLEELPDAQAGYRWSGPRGAETREDGWPANWVVIAAASGDPFIADTSNPQSPVLFARHGTGAWSPVEVASSMQDFLEGLSVFEDVLLGRFAQDVWDDGEGLRRAFLDAVARAVASVLTGPQAAAFRALLE